MASFVQVAVNVPSLAGVFDYAVPDRLSGRLGQGHLVVVPFGKRNVQGVIWRLLDQPSVPDVKDIIDLIDPEPVLTHAQIALAESLAESTLAPLAEVIGLFLPPGLNQRADTLYAIRDSGAGGHSQSDIASLPAAPGMHRSTLEARLMDLLKGRGPLRSRQIDRAIPRLDWRKNARYLVKRGMLSAQSVLPSARARPKFVRTAQLAVTPEIAEAALPELGNTVSTRTRREKALRFLMKSVEAVNVSWVYAESGCNLNDLQELAERDLILLRETEIWRDPLSRIEVNDRDDKKIILTNDQENAWQQIEEGYRVLATGKNIKPFLLQGVTGSGKTELYIRATQEAVRRGRQAIILVPEIALTPQTVHRFLARFPGQVGLVHSKLSEGERYDTWRRAQAGLLKVVIGPRSALFTPLPKIGLIVADECHDASYYQSEPPFYSAVNVAQTYAHVCGALCLLGSATPSVVQQYQAEIGTSIQLELTRRVASDSETGSARDLDLPSVHIVDMREELKAGQRGIFSRALTTALEGTLERGEQAILFLNRRGTATYVFCRDCGYVVKCPRCETPLTYHVSGGEKLLCHHCGYERQIPKRCPECGGSNIRAYGLGSEKVEAEVQSQFPGGRTLRWDWETTRQKDSHEIILSHFAAGRADVLIGTQMLAKGLDLPKVTLVGIVLADVGLHLPDPFAAERVFQVLTQVAGRAGRSSRGGQVVLQTFTPDHYVIQAAALHDVNGFYQHELASRKRLGYPPFTQLVRLEYRHYDASKAEQEAKSVAARIEQRMQQDRNKPTELIGPVPCFFPKLNGEYRWQIVLRGTIPAEILPIRGPTNHVQALSTGWRIETEPISLL